MSSGAASGKSLAPAIKGPYRTLDAWRGLAALLVMLLHCSTSIVVHEPRLISNPFYIVLSYGYLGVQMFFVISGYCIANAADTTLMRGQSVGVYAVARVRRIIPTYWIAFFIAVALTPFFTWLVRHHIIAGSTSEGHMQWSPSFFFLNLTLLGPFFKQTPLVGQAWTLCYEACFYALVAIAFVIARIIKGGSRVMLNFLHVITLICCCIALIKPFWLVFPMDLYPHFGIGVLVYDVVAKRALIARWMFACVFGLLIAHAFMFNALLGFGPYPSRPINLCAAIFAAIIVVFAPLDVRLARTYLVKSLAFVGGFSYSLYLMHFYIVGIESQVFLKRQFFLNWHYLTLIFVSACALIACWLFYLVGERPFLKRRRSTRQDLPIVAGVLPPSDASTTPAMP
jgi:exopolysaccharide production protein ExoZ